MVNELRRQGVEVSTANSAFTVGKVNVAAGDYIVRGDQPYRTLAEMYFAIQNYPTPNPRPYDDTGWTMEYLRNVKLTPLTENSVLTAPMTLLSADAAGRWRRGWRRASTLVRSSTPPTTT